VTLAPPQRTIHGNVLVHADFILTGVVMTLLGPMLPVLSARWQLNDAQAGYLFIAQFLTSVLGMALSGILVERIGYRRTLMVGLVLMATGMALLARADWLLGLAAVSIYGVGFGSNTPAGNLFAAEANPQRRASALNLLNASWGVGAMGCPLLIAAAQRAQRLHLFFYALTAGLLGLAAVLSWLRFEVDSSRPHAPKVVGEITGVWRNRSLPWVAVLFFIYVGTETSVGGWVASYARRLDLGSHAFWALTPSFFWGAMLAGRMAAPILLRRWRETAVASASLSVAIVGIIVLLAARSMTPVVVGTTLAGLGLAAIFPISVSMLSYWFGEMAARAGGAIFPLGNVGGAALPWLVGALSAQFGSLRAGFVVPLAASILMLAAYITAGRQRRNQASLYPDR
jgi:MFS transporter, FHS family, glucose/mannose:H+ symporter